MPAAPSLRELQESVLRAVLAERVPEPPVEGGGSLSAAQAVAVYRDGYFARLSEALAETYEGVWSVLGDEAFLRACRAFIVGHRSGVYNLSDYGSDFSSFLASRPESGRWPFLPELAAFEWAFKELFHREEHSPVPAASLGLAVAGSRLFLGNAVMLRRHASAVYEIWRVRKAPEALSREAWDRPERLLLYKRRDEIFARALEEPEFVLLEALGEGRTVEESVAGATRLHSELGPERVARLFAFISESGIVGRIE